MAISIIGNGGTVAEVATNTRALSVQLAPVDYGVCGSFRKSLKSGTMGAGLAANAPVWSYRWSDALRIAIVYRLALDGWANLAAFTAGFGSIQLFVARSFTAADSGGTTGTVTGHNCKLRTSSAATLVGNIQCATTAALTAGTRTLDTEPIGEITAQCAATANTILARQVDLIGEDCGREHPVILTQNEGLVAQATVPATGTWQFGITVVWLEASAF